MLDGELINEGTIEQDKLAMELAQKIVHSIPDTRTVNGKALSSNIDLDVRDIPIAIAGGTRNALQTSVKLNGLTQFMVNESGHEGLFVLNTNSTMVPDNALAIADVDGRVWERQWDGVVQAQWYGLIEGGTVDNISQLTKILKISETYPVEFPRAKKYYVSDNIHINKTFNLRFNNCYLRAPKGLIDRLAQDRTYTSSSGQFTSFTTSKNRQMIDVIPGVTDNLEIGNIVLYRALTKYNPDETGGYSDGQILKITNKLYNTVGGNQVLVGYTTDVPQYKDFLVEYIEVHTGADATLRDLTLDMSEAVADFKGFVSYCYNKIDIKNFRAYGSGPAACAGEFFGASVKIRESEGHNFRNTVGISGGGRLGYFIAVGGTHVAIEDVTGSRCKHIVTNGQRSIMTIALYYSRINASNPTADFDLVSGVSGGGPMYQHAVDVHANCLNAVIDGVKHDGCNGAIAIRNGNATITNCIFRSRSVSAFFNNRYLINCYENPIDNVSVTNCKLFVDPEISGQTEIASLIGCQPGVMMTGNGGITVDGLFQRGGKLFTSRVANTVGTLCTFDQIQFRNIDAEVVGGLDIQGTAADSPNPAYLTGAYKQISFYNSRIIMRAHADKTLRFITLDYMGQLDELTVENCYIDGTTVSDVGLVYGRFIGGKPMQYVNFRNTTMRAGRIGIQFANSTTAGWGRGDFTNFNLTYNLNPVAGATFIPGVYGSLNVSVDEWIFKNAIIRNANGIVLSSAYECLNFPILSKINIDGLNVNTPLLITDSSYWTAQAAKRDVPYSAKNIEGFISYLQYRIKDHKLNLTTANQDNFDTITAMPKVTVVPLYDNCVINNDTFNGISPYGWVASGSTWYPLIAGFDIPESRVRGSYIVAADANLTLVANNTYQLPAPTANRTIAAFSAASNPGKRITLINRNGTTFTWTMTTAWKAPDGSDVTVIPNNTTISAISDGGNWRIVVDRVPQFIDNAATTVPDKAALNTTYGFLKAGSIITYQSATGGAREFRKLTDSATGNWAGRIWSTGVTTQTT